MSTFASTTTCVPIAALFPGVAGAPTSLAPSRSPTRVANVTTLTRTVYVKTPTVITWPIVVLALLVLALVAMLWRWYRQGKELEKHGAWVHADPGAANASERNVRRDIECTVELQAWLWKRARVNLEGHHVWQQWYMAVCVPDDIESNAPWIEYFDSKRTMSRRLDPNNPTRLLPDPTGQADGETGVIGLDGLLHVEEHQENKKGYFPFALVFPDTHHGTESHVELLADTSESQAEWLSKLTSCADGPVVQTKTGRRKSSLASPGRYASKAKDKQRILDEELQPALTFGSDGERSRGDEDDQETRDSDSSPVSSRLYADIPDSISVSNVEVTPALTSVAVPPPDAVFGSVSGAVGDRVALEGWMHVSVAGGVASQRSASKWRQLYAVLLADRDELCFFRGMSEAPNGAHAYWAMKHKLALSQVVLLKDLGTGGNKRLEACLELEVMAIAGQAGQQDTSGISTVFYLMSESRSNAIGWLSELDEVLKTKYGRDVVARVPGGDPSLDDRAPVAMLADFPQDIAPGIALATPGASSTTAVDGFGIATPAPLPPSSGGGGVGGSAKRRESSQSKSGRSRRSSGSGSGEGRSGSTGRDRSSGGGGVGIRQVEASRVSRARKPSDGVSRRASASSTVTSRSDDAYSDFERMLRRGSRAGDDSV
jgi:hypothetical protein